MAYIKKNDVICYWGDYRDEKEAGGLQRKQQTSLSLCFTGQGEWVLWKKKYHLKLETSNSRWAEGVWLRRLRSGRYL